MSCASWALVGKIATGLLGVAVLVALAGWVFLRQTAEARD